MLKAVFFIKHRYEIDDIEITPEQQPQLFAFLNRLADEAKAPRPHRVFLSPRVNAAVFYDLSIVELAAPIEKESRNRSWVGQRAEPWRIQGSVGS